jgi:hypothetical protein
MLLFFGINAQRKLIINITLILKAKSFKVTLVLLFNGVNKTVNNHLFTGFLLKSLKLTFSFSLTLIY